MAAAPGCRILLFTAHADGAAVQSCLEAGAAGCLLKDVGTQELIRGLHAVAAGSRVLDRGSAAAPTSACASGSTRG